MIQHPQNSHELAWAFSTMITNVGSNLLVKIIQFLSSRLILTSYSKKNPNPKSWKVIQYMPIHLFLLQAKKILIHDS